MCVCLCVCVSVCVCMSVCVCVLVLRIGLMKYFTPLPFSENGITSKWQ